MVELKTKEEIAVMKRGGEILRKILNRLVQDAQPGVSLHSLDRLAEKLCSDRRVRPPFKGYKSKKSDKPFPFALCTSVNAVIVHAPPTNYLLKKGDLLKLDFGVLYQGFYLDSAETMIVGGEGTKEARHLIDTTRRALGTGIQVARVGNTVGDIGAAISQVVKKAGYHVVQGLTGHGIGRDLHEDPVIHNEGERGKGMPLEEGMVIAIEPMVGVGTGKVVRQKDDSFKIADGSLGAHSEDTIAITKEAPLILTRVSV